MYSTFHMNKITDQHPCLMCYINQYIPPKFIPVFTPISGPKLTLFGEIEYLYHINAQE